MANDKPIAETGPRPRSVILWSFAALVFLFLCWFAAAVVVPVWQVRQAMTLLIEIEEVKHGAFPMADEKALVEDLGGPKATLRKMRLYLHMPGWIAVHRGHAAYFLRYGGEEALPAFAEALKDRDPEARRYALRGLVGLAIDTKHPFVAPLVVGALGDSDASVRGEAVQLMPMLARAVPDVVPSLREALRGSKPVTLQCAALAVGRMGECGEDLLLAKRPLDEEFVRLTLLAKEAVPELEALLEHKDPQTRCIAAAGLWMVTGDGRKPLELLLGALKDPAPKVRCSALLALAQLGSCAEAATPAVAKAGEDADKDVREAASYARGRCDVVIITDLRDSYEEMDKVISLLADPNWEVRARGALQCECSLYEDEAVPALQKALQDENECVRDCAAYALRNCREVQPGPLVVKMECAENGTIKYHIGHRKALEGEKALSDQVAKLLKSRLDPSVRIDLYIGVDPVFQRELDAAKAACEAAGAKVVATPELLSRDVSVSLRAGKREAELRVRAVGVRDGMLQYRFADRLAEGEVALTQALRKWIDEVEKEKGGFTRVNPRWDVAEELVLSQGQYEAIDAAIANAGSEMVRPFGYHGGGGRRKNAKPVRVNVIAPCADGNRYMLDGQPIEGEAALKDALQKLLAEHRAGKESPENYTLWVELKAEVKPGITATEEQLELARKTVIAAGVDQPRKQ